MLNRLVYRNLYERHESNGIVWFAYVNKIYNERVLSDAVTAVYFDGFKIFERKGGSDEVLSLKLNILKWCVCFWLLKVNALFFCV